MSSSILLTSCLATGTWLSMWFPDPCARRASGLPANAIVLCAPDECAEARDRIAVICRDSGYPAGQRIPVLPLAGVSCLCPCPGAPPQE
ncbi:MAG TPA: hypothetical protein VLJ37_03030 [bacterium]|nr:hypothetical protein [bacterium]